MITIHSIKGYDEATDVLLLLAKTFREKPDRKRAYTDVMNLVTPRILKLENAVVEARKNTETKPKGERL